MDSSRFENVVSVDASDHPDGVPAELQAKVLVRVVLVSLCLYCSFVLIFLVNTQMNILWFIALYRQCSTSFHHDWSRCLRAGYVLATSKGISTAITALRADEPWIMVPLDLCKTLRSIGTCKFLLCAQGNSSVCKDTSRTAIVCVNPP